MLVWSGNDGKRNFYQFMTDYYDAQATTIFSNGNDSAVLLGIGIFSVLANKYVCRALTDEEAETVNKNITEGKAKLDAIMADEANKKEFEAGLAKAAQDAVATAAVKLAPDKAPVKEK